MNKTTLPLFLAGIITGSVGAPLIADQFRAEAQAPQLYVVNMKLVRHDLADGGWDWSTRACAYVLQEDGGHTEEPCWNSQVSHDAVKMMYTEVLNQAVAP